MLVKKYRPFFFLSILLLLTDASSVAQIPGYKSYKVDEDNTGTKIFSLFKNNEGYLFVGCNNGLYKFDGISFAKIENTKAPAEDTVTAIFQDKGQQVWTGYQSGHLAKIAAGKLQYLDPEEGTPKKRITAILEDNKNNIWFSTRGEGIYYFSGKRMYLINDADGLSDLNVHAMAMAANGDIITATDQGINICTVNGAQKKVTVIGPAQGLPDYIVTAIVPAGNDNFWIGMQDKGICLYNHTSKKITAPFASASWNKGQVNALITSENIVWIATQDSGLVSYSPASNQFVSVPVLTAPQRSINHLLQDNQGNLWLSADNNILIRTACNSLHIFPFYNDAVYATIHTILADDEGNYWAGSDMAIIKYQQTPLGIIAKKYPVAGLDIKTDITSLYQDKFHNIWIGTMGSGIYILNPQTGESRHLNEVITTGSTSILSITGNGNTICTAGLEGALVFELNEENKGIGNKYNFTSYNNIETIGSTYIYNVFKDSRQRIWFATDGKGLTMLINNVFTHYDEKNGIRDGHIYSVAEDKKGNIWFSTSNAGIYSFDGKSFRNYSLKEGLSSLSVAAIKTDKLGNIVVVHKNGLDIINSQTGNFSYINAAQGITSINDDLGAICTDSHGNIFVATQKGILQYTGIAGASNIPKTIIETVQLFLNDIDTTTTHYFKHDENNITFNFAGLYYTSPENVFYQYKLEGFDSSWQFTSDNSKSFPKLAPGKYTFRVQSSLSKNFSNASEAVYVFKIAKPIWKEWWFITGYLLVAAGLLYWYIKRREKNLQQVERLQNEKIKFEFEVLRNQVNPHFLFNSFNTLISTIEENPSVAVEYVEHLSDFFRNIVNYRNKSVISLEEEKGILRSYMYMQQKRYGDSLQLRSNLTATEKKQFFLPPLTLQLLVENAIKHNVVSREAALVISMFTKDGYIVVQNNINKKMKDEKGTGMGLQNIINRYALLCDKPVIVNSTNEFFTVSLPILKHE